MRGRDQIELTLVRDDDTVALKTEEAVAPGDFVSKSRQRQIKLVREPKLEEKPRGNRDQHHPETLVLRVVAQGRGRAPQCDSFGEKREREEAVNLVAVTWSLMAGNGQDAPATVTVARCRESTGREREEGGGGSTVWVEPGRPGRFDRRA